MSHSGTDRPSREHAAETAEDASRKVAANFDWRMPRARARQRRVDRPETLANNRRGLYLRGRAGGFSALPAALPTHVFGIGVQNPLGVPIQTSVDLPAQRSNAFSALPQTLPARTYSELFL
jgi:hypothetical protein